MNEQDLKFDDVYHLEAVMCIFEKTTTTSVMGSEPSRMRLRYGWSPILVHNKLAFWRREIQATALLLDAIDAGRAAKPYSASLWPGWVASFTSDAQFDALLKTVESAQLPRFTRALLEAAKLDQRLPHDRPIANFWTVDQMAGSIGISRESVYKRSDIRRGDGLGLQTIEFAGMSLWYPLRDPETFVLADLPE